MTTKKAKRVIRRGAMPYLESLMDGPLTLGAALGGLREAEQRLLTGGSDFDRRQGDGASRERRLGAQKLRRGELAAPPTSRVFEAGHGSDLAQGTVEKSGEGRRRSVEARGRRAAAFEQSTQDRVEPIDEGQRGQKVLQATHGRAAGFGDAAHEEIDGRIAAALECQGLDDAGGIQLGLQVAHREVEVSSSELDAPCVHLGPRLSAPGV